MRDKIKKLINNPYKAAHYFSVASKKRIQKKKGTLFIIGMDVFGEFSIIHPGYKICYGFEANPSRYNRLLQKYGKYKNIRLYNVAIADHDGEIDFNISSNNDGASSSIGNFNELWRQNRASKDIKMIETIKVPCINLMNFCEKNNITYIDDYISDIQGMDLQVLKTLKPMIDKKRIGSIKCEVAKDKHSNIYYDLPDNSESGFNNLLGNNYELIAKGYGLLKNYKFDDIPEDAWEMDCKWKVKL